MCSDRQRKALADLRTSAQSLTAIAIAMQARRQGAVRENALIRHGRAVVEAHGLGEAMEGAADGQADRWLAEIRADVLFAARLLGQDFGTGGWRQGDADLHQAFGDVSASFADLLRDRIAPQLPGLAQRLSEPDAAFLDIGTGVGALSIGMMRVWPELRVVGIEPLAETVELACRNVAAAGYAHRMEVRVGRGEDFDEAGAFDLVFIPSAFIPESAVPAILERATRALRPGGWILVAKVEPGRAPLTAALARFRVASWGGTIFEHGEAEAMLRGVSLQSVMGVEARPGAAFGLAAGQRP